MDRIAKTKTRQRTREVACDPLCADVNKYDIIEELLRRAFV